MNRTRALLFTICIASIISVSACSIADTLEERDERKAPISRELPWDGSETLILGAPAEVRFVQAPGPGKVVITGARRSVDSFYISKGVLNDRTHRTGEQLKIVVTAPKVTRFSAKGGDKLTIEAFDQDRLEIETTGRAEITASGRAGTIKLHLQGSGWADLSRVRTQGAEVSLTGFRNAIIAPSAWATISGSGDVVLLTTPTTLDHQGPGRLIRPSFATEPA